jgi:hypothetical protein
LTPLKLPHYMADMLSRTTTFLASVIVIANFTACSTPYSDVYSFKKNKFQPPVEKKTEISVPAAALNPLEGATAPALDPAMTIPGVPGATPAPGIPGLPTEAAPTAPLPTAPPLEAPPGTPPATTPVPAPGTPPAPGATPAIPGL